MARAGWPQRVRVVEVGTRDGFQAEPTFVPTAVKIDTINRLIEAGVRRFEVTSFVSPKAVPQLADAALVMAGIDRRPDVELTALVPNPKGAEAAAKAGVDAMVVFCSASASHNAKNVNRTIARSLEGFRDVVAIAEAAGSRVQGAIATAFGCPFEGDVATAAVVDLAKAYADLGIRHVTLGDTTGMATPPLVRERCRALRAALPESEIALHFHNTRGIGLVNVYAGLLEGIDLYESAIGGLGGCPFAPGATGNICTEDLLYLLDECGIETGIDLAAVVAVAKRIEAEIGRELPGQVMKAGPRLALRRLDEVRTACG
ncbi:MAG: hydroxymethylglutaryl-CoA lyase [Geminicoccaceae bacterium]|nr:MAG: hydroxymethylglutaryl-CoA lyase [Geminicoccaceae bacterium]